MAENMSRREMLGLTAAAVGGVAALRGGAHAGTPEDQVALEQRLVRAHRA